MKYILLHSSPGVGLEGREGGGCTRVCVHARVCMGIGKGKGRKEEGEGEKEGEGEEKVL